MWNLVPRQKHEDEYVNVNYSQVKFSRMVANRKYRENKPAAKNTRYIYIRYKASNVKSNGSHLCGMYHKGHPYKVEVKLHIRPSSMSCSFAPFGGL